jgi:hypothetical protein
VVVASAHTEPWRLFALRLPRHPNP